MNQNERTFPSSRGGRGRGSRDRSFRPGGDERRNWEPPYRQQWDEEEWEVGPDENERFGGRFEQERTGPGSRPYWAGSGERHTRGQPGGYGDEREGSDYFGGSSFGRRSGGGRWNPYGDSRREFGGGLGSEQGTGGSPYGGPARGESWRGSQGGRFEPDPYAPSGSPEFGRGGYAGGRYGSDSYGAGSYGGGSYGAGSFGGRYGGRSGSYFGQEFGPEGAESEEYERGASERFGTYGLRGRHAGRGPKGYQRGDERIKEDVSEALTHHPAVDATEITIEVRQGEVTLEGTVESREVKRMAEDCAERASGVKQVHNRLRVQKPGEQGRDAGSNGSGTSPDSRTGAGGRSKTV